MREYVVTAQLPKSVHMSRLCTSESMGPFASAARRHFSRVFPTKSKPLSLPYVLTYRVSSGPLQLFRDTHLAGIRCQNKSWWTSIRMAQARVPLTTSAHPSWVTIMLNTSDLLPQGLIRSLPRGVSS